MLDVYADWVPVCVDINDEPIPNLMRVDAGPGVQVDVERIGLRVVMELHLVSSKRLAGGTNRRSRNALWTVLPSDSVTPRRARFPSSGRSPHRRTLPSACTTRARGRA